MLAGQLLILISQGGGDEETEPLTSNSPILTHLKLTMELPTLGYLRYSLTPSHPIFSLALANLPL
jgi:hypothetical protein